MGATKKLNLLLVSGNATVSDGEINYLGDGTKNEAENNTGAPIVPTPPVDVRTNSVLIDGDLSFNFTLNGVDARIIITLWTPNDNLLVCINESPSLCSIKRFDGKQFSLLNSVGSSSASPIGIATNLKIRNKAGLISILFNDVMVLTHYFPNNGAGLSFSLFGGDGIFVQDVTILDKTPKVFVVMEFQKAFDELYSEVIKPTCESLGFEVTRADESFNNGSIIHEILTELIDSTIVIADITPNNPNVYYEVGYAHAIKKDVILLCNETRERLPFDLADFRTIFYKDSIAGHAKVTEKLTKHIENMIGSNASKPRS
ncbi:hypothetical protein [Escherichia coli]|uniref:hypothetical protein n=1 Tax=Escherichia coli TaxID=562 RepID=UPI000BDF42C3|nr:hypothetical protein [Escherichia coli]EHX2159153.1 hypothetical protein [Escherichia coli]